MATLMEEDWIEGEGGGCMQAEYVENLALCYIICSVADPGSFAFLTPGSGIRDGLN